MAETTENDHYTDEEEALVGDAEAGSGSEGEEEEYVVGQKRKLPTKGSADGFSKRGVVYLSRVPPNMNPSHVRQMFSRYGEVQRIYLVPEGNNPRHEPN
jgi:ESF2/ABP1 family protein